MNTEDDRALRDLADRAALQDLVSNYSHALDARDEALFRSLWDTSAVWYFPQVPGMNLQGYAAIVEFFQQPRQRKPSHHLVSNHVVQLNGDRAVGRCKALSTGHDQPHFVTYEDEYIRSGGQWKFSRRTVTADLPDPSRLPGTQPPSGVGP
jgi:hypothetical protein